MTVFGKAFGWGKGKRIGPLCLEQVEMAFEAYRREVEASQLAPATKRTYLHHAETFVRWMRGDFEPGGRV